MNDILYAIQVKWQPDDWVYYTEGPANDLRVKVYSCSETAENFAELLRVTGKEDRVKVVVYKEDE